MWALLLLILIFFMKKDEEIFIITDLIQIELGLISVFLIIKLALLVADIGYINFNFLEVNIIIYIL